MSESARDLLVRGIAAAKAREVDEASFFLSWVLRTDCSLEQRADALYWLGVLSEDPESKRAFFEEALTCRPNHYDARRHLAVLDGHLDPQEIIDPDKPLPSPADQSPSAQAQRFVCPQCGGRLTYTPDGSTLICEYCTRKQSFDASNATAADLDATQDFTIAMATARGHARPVAVRTFDCQACGATFLLAPQTVSLTCPYCASVYVAQQAETRHLIPPQSLIPFKVSENRARQTLVAWIKQQRVPASIRSLDLHGFYFPAWVFTLSGPLPWDCLVPDDRDSWSPMSGLELAVEGDVLVPASHSIPEKFLYSKDQYDFTQLIPYDPAYLADWPAETYQISLSEASLEARSRVLEKALTAVKNKIHAFHKDLHLDTKDLLIETFQLILLPLWMSHYQYQGQRHLLLINGQIGKIWGTRLERGVRTWLASWFNDS